MIDKKDWPALVAGLRNTLVEHATVKVDGEERANPKAVRDRRVRLKWRLRGQDRLNLNLKMDDGTAWHEIALKPFYSYRQAATVDKREAYLRAYLNDYELLCGSEWDWDDSDFFDGTQWKKRYSSASNSNGVRYNEFTSDPDCIRDHERLQKTITAARLIKGRWEIYPHRTILDNITELRKTFDTLDDLKFAYENAAKYLALGQVTTFHLLMDLGFKLVKPDSVLSRIAINMGLVTSYPVRKKAKKKLSVQFLMISRTS